MNHSERVPKSLFKASGHYMGRPADFTDRIIQRRIDLVRNIPQFIGRDLTLLDIGCGNGASMFMIAPEMKHCLGIEITDHHLPVFDQHKQLHHLDNCDCIILDIEKQQLEGSFDRIISFEVVEHLEREESISFYYNVLKRGGLMAISVPNKWWIFETHGAKLPLLPWNRVPFFSWLPRTLHERFANARIYTKKRIIKLLERHGFTVVKTSYITAPMDVLPKGKIKNFLIKYFFNQDTTNIPVKSTSIFVVAQKN